VHANDCVKTLEANPPSDDKFGKSETRKKKNKERETIEISLRADAPLLDIFSFFFLRICVTRICMTRLLNAICPSCSRITWISICRTRERPLEKWRGKSRNVNLFSIRWWTTFDIWTITRYVATHINRCALHIMQWRESTSQELIHGRRLCFQTATRWLSSFIISSFDQSEITLHYL